MQPSTSASATLKSDAKHGFKSVPEVPQKTRKIPKLSRISQLNFKKNDRVKFLNFCTKTLVHGIIDGTFPNDGKYHIKTENDQFYVIRDAFVLADNAN